ncbi:DUF4832 domain-containing protein [Amycolatopsis sp., V23-08]|uniref:DUF4832 domain-containing protein n=1 Tax=Amycolatopsis heterodermiae TaxID=3110235 RepID=A0ABU5R8S3_9PSEU|nr:DUF4832 domain-containing protein [Amycolatopsis sp., V23-08]MEA5362595.1 DUF4832 domain-containing protein [Amycolatopsis sp., V23-08]
MSMRTVAALISTAEQVRGRTWFMWCTDLGCARRSRPGASAGYAAAAHPRTVSSVLRNTATGVVTRIPLAADPRTWLPGAQTVTVPSSPAPGTYALCWNWPIRSSVTVS